MLKLFKRNVFRVQTVEQFLHWGDAASRQIMLTTCYLYGWWVYIHWFDFVAFVPRRHV